MLGKLAVLAPLAIASMASAQLSGLRATIPGSLHQCEDTNMFFFDSSNSRPLTVLFLPSSEVPDSIRSGTVNIQDAAQYSPLQVIQGISTPDAAAYDFTLQIAEGQAFEVFGFLEDGSGKALSLTRTVTTPLPSASSCLSGVQTTVSGVAAAAAVTSSSSSASSSSSSAASSRVVRTTSASSSAASTSAASSSASSSSTRTTTVPTTAAAVNTDPAAISSIASSTTGAATKNALISAAALLGAAAIGVMAFL